eukprot:CAMPEP_0171925728 /NCGR_PEP_ID=MMETSP0993-20121228/24268_1 /TAXON_ID=483369 /ORGANISM="non described non described, Strain CCMP2098" /LENGTH=59 /DNA_ID=CAMNT_0012564401 /DNA_START=415 /DNA_END=591 /DNA_ORIENTATION=+
MTQGRVVRFSPMDGLEKEFVMTNGQVKQKHEQRGQFEQADEMMVVLMWFSWRFSRRVSS